MLRQDTIKSSCIQAVRLILFIGGLLLLVGGDQALAQSPPAEGRPINTLYFIENQGQIDRQVSYYLQTEDKILYFTPTGVTIALTGIMPSSTADSWVVKLDFVGGSARPIGQDRMKTVVSYFRRSPEQGKTGLPTYAQLVYSDLWPGIDLIYTLDDNQLKYQFLVQPGADPNQIRLAYRGAAEVRLTAAGQLEVSTPVASFLDAPPHAYQDIAGRRVPIAVTYHLDPPATAETYEYGFRLGIYDATRILVLDPAILLYAGFIGGLQRENGNGIAVDGAGNAYVTGRTHTTTDFPVVVGPDLTHNGGSYFGDAFIAKVQADGSGLVYAGFIGGAGEDYGYDVAVDAAGNAYVTGETTSNNLPTTPGVYDPSYNGGQDAFVAKVNMAGTGLVYLTYIGDVVSTSTNDSGKSIAVDSSGNAYVLVDTSFGPYGGGYDTSVVKLNAAGSAGLYVEYIGGNGDDRGDSLAVETTGNVYLTGRTTSNNMHTAGVYDTTYNGGGDAFAAKVRTTIPRLVYATYIGDVVSPSTDDSGAGIAVNGSGNAYVLVNTSFGPYGDYDTSVVKLNAAGSALLFIEYIGGTGNDFGSGLAIDNLGRIYLSGNTASTDFPVTNWPPTVYTAPQEAFAAQVEADGTGLIYAGFIAGSGTGSADIAVDSNGSAYVTGTNWRGEDFPARIGPDLSANGERDAFVVKISPLLFPAAYLPIILK